MAGAEADSVSLRSHDSLSSQIRTLESNFEQLLAQTSSSLRKDMASREDRLTRRMDSDRKEQASTIYKLKRDVSVQQNADLSAQEDRLTRRLDAERREQREALSEVRRELSQLQAAIARLDKERGTGPVTSNGSPESSLPARAAASVSEVNLLEQAVKASEAQLRDLLREQNSQKEFLETLQRQETKNEAALGNLRKEFLSQQGEEARNLQEHVSRSHRELSRTFEQMAGTIEQTSTTLRSEIRREADKLRTELTSTRSSLVPESEKGVEMDGRLDDLQKQLEAVRKSAGPGSAPEALATRLSALEAKVQDTDTFATRAVVPRINGDEAQDISKLQDILNETRAVADQANSNVVQLAQDLAEQRAKAEFMEASVRNQARTSSDAALPSKVAEIVGNVTKDVTREVERAERRLSDMLRERVQAVESTCNSSIQAIKASMRQHEQDLNHVSQDLIKERAERCKLLADVSCKAEDASALAERVEKKLQEEGSRKPNGMAPSTATDAGESASEVAHLGQRASTVSIPGFGSADHVALAACVGELDAELRVELAEKLNSVISDCKKDIASKVLAAEEKFAKELEGVVAPMEKLGSRVDKLEAARLDLRLGALESAAHRASASLPGNDRASLFTSSASARVPVATSSFGMTEPAPEDAAQATVMQLMPSSLDRTQQVESLDPRAFEHGADSADYQPEPDYQPELSPDSFEPLISDDLKSRLENLVEQVKETLNATQVNQSSLLDTGSNYQQDTDHTRYQEQQYVQYEPGQQVDSYQPHEQLQQFQQFQQPLEQQQYQQPYEQEYMTTTAQYQQPMMPRYHGSIALPIQSDARSDSGYHGGAYSDHGGHRTWGSLQVPVDQPEMYGYTGSLDGEGGSCDGGGFEVGFASTPIPHNPIQPGMLANPDFRSQAATGQVSYGPAFVVTGQPVLHSVNITRGRAMSPVREASPLREVRAISPVRGMSPVRTSSPVRAAYPRHRSPSPVRHGNSVNITVAVPADVPQTHVQPSSFAQITPAASFVPQTPSMLPRATGFEQVGMLPQAASFPLQQPTSLPQSGSFMMTQHPQTMQQQPQYAAPLQEAQSGDSCPVCGNMFASDAKFCRRCGAKRPQDDDSGSSDEEDAPAAQKSGFISSLFSRPQD
eukprot:TRINITY_DN16289_c0_g1_i1.p1 TRINITY_DN16289_c0_g1~~TRINITY_DN16289_c0_g1_i1.p1  ORF type:complete len:1133 (-),score=255.16 TRINITY_DN16289_c0_g1_i1:123-3521(-)